MRACQARPLSRKTSSMKHRIDESRERIYFRPEGTPRANETGEAGEIPVSLYLVEVPTYRRFKRPMSFVAYCFICEKKVTAHTLLDAPKLLVALANHYDVEVMHTSDSGDHRWKLNREEKARLLNHIRKSMYNN